MTNKQYISRARELFEQHGGMLRTSQAIGLGIHPRVLYALRDEQEIEKIGRGLYRLATAAPLTNPDWVAIAARAPQAVICLISALSHHNLTTQVPHANDIALTSHARIPRMGEIPIRVFWFSVAAHKAGVELVRMNGTTIKIYSPEKTIADCFKYRNKIGLDVAVEALRSYREKNRKPDLKGLLHYARVCRVERIMRPYLEALV